MLRKDKRMLLQADEFAAGGKMRGARAESEGYLFYHPVATTEIHSFVQGKVCQVLHRQHQVCFDSRSVRSHPFGKRFVVIVIQKDGK